MTNSIPNKMDEMIVVVPRVSLFGANDELVFQGTTVDSHPIFAHGMLDRIAKNVEICRRGDMEEDNSFKQIIPYVILYSDIERLVDGIVVKERYVYTYQRLTGGGESRLHNKLSIGVGGHMNTLTTLDDFKEEARRELLEELFFDDCNPDEFEYEFLGLLNDDSDEVGRVHLGVLIGVKVPSYGIVTVKERDQLDGDWERISDMTNKLELFGRLEPWSQLAIKVLAQTRSL